MGRVNSALLSIYVKGVVRDVTGEGPVGYLACACCLGGLAAGAVPLMKGTVASTFTNTVGGVITKAGNVFTG